MNAKLKQFLKNSRMTRPFLPILYGLKYSQFRPCPFIKFIWYNLFCSKVKIDWMNNGLIYPTVNSVIELQKGAVVELHGPLIVGSKKLRRSCVETRLLLEKNAHLEVREYFRIGYGSDVEVLHKGKMQIGNCGTNFRCTIICGKCIELQGRVAIGREVSIRDTNAHCICIDGYKVMRPVIIENHTWLCSGVTISPGVKVKEGSVVGACSYVIQNVPAHSLVSGHPAKVVMKDIEWEL